MKIHNRFTAIAIDPVQRIIHVHAKSVKRARHNLRCCLPAFACPPMDVGQCRIVVNALRREIDRLLRGIDRFDRYIPLNTSTSSNHNEGDSEFSRLAAPRQPRKLYAPAPLGQPLAHVPLPSTQRSGADIISAPRITNLGTRLDVLI